MSCLRDTEMSELMARCNDDSDDDAPEVDTARGESSAEEPAEPPRVRARTISIKRLSKRELERGRQLYPEEAYARPVTRADCIEGGAFAARPCPFVSCKYHLYLDVSESTGAIKINWPAIETDELPVSCALDVADLQGATLEQVGAITNLTRERVRQMETKGLAKLKALTDLAALQDYVDE